MKAQTGTIAECTGSLNAATGPGHRSRFSDSYRQVANRSIAFNEFEMKASAWFANNAPYYNVMFFLTTRFLKIDDRILIIHASECISGSATCIEDISSLLCKISAIISSDVTCFLTNIYFSFWSTVVMFIILFLIN